MARECEYCGEQIEQLKNCIEIKIGRIGSQPRMFYVHSSCSSEISIEGII